jgi:hypothetical protein
VDKVIPGLSKAVDQPKREIDSQLTLVGLGMRTVSAEVPSFQEHFKTAVEACLMNSCYWKDDPNPGAFDFSAESDAILFHTAEILAGQRWPDSIFSNTGKPGAWHRARAEQLALAWMQKRGTSGFSEWNSPVAYERDLAALAHLTTYAENDLVKELAAVLMDKIFFLLAVNSYWGSFGSAWSHRGIHEPKAQLDATPVYHA